jgi:Fur family ferric uptake transcriptional regulator/Fur family peroxide stress response transcriptional regulator
MRYSSQREIIYNILIETNCHPTADWIFNKARKLIPKISLGTVYRNLNQLADEDMIRVIQDSSVIRYDGNVQDHDHLRCTECHTLYDVTNLTKNLEKKVKERFQFMVKRTSLTLEGICSKH